jgi:hypothetical protein
LVEWKFCLFYGARHTVENEKDLFAGERYSATTTAQYFDAQIHD